MSIFEFCNTLHLVQIFYSDTEDAEKNPQIISALKNRVGIRNSLGKKKKLVQTSVPDPDP